MEERLIARRVIGLGSRHIQRLSGRFDGPRGLPPPQYPPPVRANTKFLDPARVYSHSSTRPMIYAAALALACPAPLLASAFLPAPVACHPAQSR